METGGEKRKGHSFVVVCDTFDWEDYPVYVKRGEKLAEIKAKYDGVNMQKIMEVIKL